VLFFFVRKPKQELETKQQRRGGGLERKSLKENLGKKKGHSNGMNLAPKDLEKTPPWGWGAIPQTGRRGQFSSGLKRGFHTKTVAICPNL